MTSREPTRGEEEITRCDDEKNSQKDQQKSFKFDQKRLLVQDEQNGAFVRAEEP